MQHFVCHVIVMKKKEMKKIREATEKCWFTREKLKGLKCAKYISCINLCPGKKCDYFLFDEIPAIPIPEFG